MPAQATVPRKVIIHKQKRIILYNKNKFKEFVTNKLPLQRLLKGKLGSEKEVKCAQDGTRNKQII